MIVLPLEPSGISKKLKSIFPEGIPDRNFFIRDLAARSIYVFLYINAIEGSEIWLAPKHILRMSEKQSRLNNPDERRDYAIACMKPGYKPKGEPWYKENTREPIRDETINGLVNLGLITLRPGIATTSSKGRYQLKKAFAELFSEDASANEIEKWQSKYLSESHLAKIKIMRRVVTSEGVIISLPNGTTRKMEAGPSSVLTKSIVEEFTKQHLKKAAIMWISESGNKVVAEDDDLMKSINLPIDRKILLPDVVIADLGRKELLLVFVEIVATDGPFTENRKQGILKMCLDAGFKSNQVLFVSAFKDRNDRALKSRLSAIATDSLVWCATEPEVLIWIGKDQIKPFMI